MFARSIFFVEMAVLLVVAACSALLLINANSVDDLLLSVFEETGEQRILDVSRDMEKSMSSLNPEFGRLKEFSIMRRPS